METVKINANEEYIRLDNLLKISGICSTGGQAKVIIQSGLVTVNGEICTMRGKKLRSGDIAKYEDNEVKVE